MGEIKQEKRNGKTIKKGDEAFVDANGVCRTAHARKAASLYVHGDEARL